MDISLLEFCWKSGLSVRERHVAESRPLYCPVAVAEVCRFGGEHAEYHLASLAHSPAITSPYLLPAYTQYLCSSTSHYLRMLVALQTGSGRARLQARELRCVREGETEGGMGCMDRVMDGIGIREREREDWLGAGAGGGYLGQVLI